MATETVSHKNLQLTVITPARAVLTTTASSVVAPAFDGEVGVMPGHAAMLAVLGTGELRVSGADGKVRSLVIRGGFLQINHDKVTVLTPESVSAEEIKVDDLNAELVKLNELPRVKAEDFATYENQKAWLKAKEKVAAKK